MKHHRPDLLIEAVSEFAHRYEVQLYVIGSKFQSLTVPQVPRARTRISGPGGVDLFSRTFS